MVGHNPFTNPIPDPFSANDELWNTFEEDSIAVFRSSAEEDSTASELAQTMKRAAAPVYDFLTKNIGNTMWQSGFACASGR